MDSAFTILPLLAPRVLLLVAKHGGTEEAIRISKLFLYQWRRDGQLLYASMPANIAHGDAVIQRCQSWLAQNYEHPDIVSELVAQPGLPKRTFDRRFRSATGYSPLADIQALRIEEAKQLLETGSAPVETVAHEVGYADTASFRRLFRRPAGMTPGDYGVSPSCGILSRGRCPRRPRNRRPRATRTLPQGSFDVARNKGA